MIPVQEHLIGYRGSFIPVGRLVFLPECDVYKSPQHKVRHGFQFTFFRDLNVADLVDHKSWHRYNTPGYLHVDEYYRGTEHN